MVIRQSPSFVAGPSGRRHSKRTPLIVAVSLGVHAAVAAYLAAMQFAPPKAPEIIEERPMKVDVYTRPKPPPPPQAHKPQPPSIRLHTPAPIPSTPPIEPVRVEPAPELPQAVGPVASLTPPAPPPAPRAPEIGAPTWLKRPGAKEFARFYPDRAQRMGVEGAATITCAVTAAGGLTGCRLLRETPEDYGFGAATLKLAPYFRMSPRTVDGQPVEGGQVTIPIRFTLG
jgi:protein TonB